MARTFSRTSQASDNNTVTPQHRNIPRPTTMATTDAFKERVDTALRKLLLEEYPQMKISSAIAVARAGADTVAWKYKAV